MNENNLINQQEKIQSKDTLTPLQIQNILDRYPKRKLSLAKTHAKKLGITIEQLIQRQRNPTKAGFNRSNFEARGFRQQLPEKLKKKLLIDIARKNIQGGNQDKIAKKYHISPQTLCNIYNRNREEYNQIFERLANSVKNRAILAAELGLKCVKRKEFKKLNVLQISQATKNFNEIAIEKETPTVNINIPIPESREKLVQMILDTEPVSSPTVNPTDNVT